MDLLEEIYVRGKDGNILLITTDNEINELYDHEIAELEVIMSSRTPSVQWYFVVCLVTIASGVK